MCESVLFVADLPTKECHWGKGNFRIGGGRNGHIWSRFCRRITCIIFVNEALQSWCCHESCVCLERCKHRCCCCVCLCGILCFCCSSCCISTGCIVNLCAKDQGRQISSEDGENYKENRTTRHLYERACFCCSQLSLAESHLHLPLFSSIILVQIRLYFVPLNPAHHCIALVPIAPNVVRPSEMLLSIFCYR